MTEKMEFTACEQTLAHRAATLVAVSVDRALRAHSVPRTLEQDRLTSTITARAVTNLIAHLRTLRDGWPVEEQDRWIEAVSLVVVCDVWGLVPREPTPEERRHAMKKLLD